MTQLTSIVLPLLKQAGAMALSHWPGGKEKKDFTVEIKEDGSQVTSVDIAINKFLVDELSLLFPEDGFFTEEQKPKDDIDQKEYVWVIDPIDGTSSFIKGKKEFGVFIARVKDSKAVFGAVYFPARQIILLGSKGNGASCYSYNESKSQWSESELKLTGESALPKCSVYVRSGEISNNDYLYPESLGSAHGIYSLCISKVSGFIVYLGLHKEWDLAPWVPIIEEAGGKISDGNGSDITFHFADPQYSELVAGISAFHNDLLGLIVKDDNNEKNN